MKIYIYFHFYKMPESIEILVFIKKNIDNLEKKTSFPNTLYMFGSNNKSSQCVLTEGKLKSMY